MAVSIGHLSFETRFKESRGDKLSAPVWEMDACFSDELQYLQAEWLAAQPAVPTARQNTSIHKSGIQHFDSSPPKPNIFYSSCWFFLLWLHCISASEES